MSEEESNLVLHAKRELALAGLLDAESDYDGELGVAALEIVHVFDKQGHSGASAAMVISLVEKLLRYEPLTPLTADPDEWMPLDEEVFGKANVFQSRRDSKMFSEDGGRTYYSVDDSSRSLFYTVDPKDAK